MSISLPIVDQLRISEQRLAAILHVVADSIVTIDGQQRITLFNRAAERMFGFEAAEVLGQPLEILLPEDVRAHHASYVNGFVASGENARWMSERGEIRGRRKNGEVFPAEATICSLEIGDEHVCTVVMRDITQRKEAEALLKAQALRDELTGLHNRRGFLELGQQELHLARRAGVRCVLLYLDMDGFKAINDEYGHPEGDSALVEVAGILRRTFREADVVARMGGDEFTVLAVCDGPESERTIRQRLEAELAGANAKATRPYSLRLSIGSALWDPAEPTPLVTLMARADASLLEAKRRRKSRGARETFA